MILFGGYIWFFVGNTEWNIAVEKSLNCILVAIPQRLCLLEFQLIAILCSLPLTCSHIARYRLSTLSAVFISFASQISDCGL